MQMASSEGCPAPFLDLVNERAGLLRREPLVPVVVHHHDRRAIARAQALDFDHRKLAIRRRLARMNPELRAQFLGNTLGTQQRA